MRIEIDVAGEIVERQELLNGTETVSLEGVSRDGRWTLSGLVTWNIGLKSNTGEGDITLTRDDGAELFGTLVQGEVTVYEARGQYQIIVRAVELQGVGAAQIAFEKLKQKLAAEGFFAPERKRALPKFPQRIGLVTSPTGAAIRDVIHVSGRRPPKLESIFAPCRVQG